MKQEPLYPPEESTLDVLAWVRGKLSGFSTRQKLRSDERRRKREARKQRPSARKERRQLDLTEEGASMLKVTWRAIFEFPQGVLNPLGLKVPGRQEVELYSTGARMDVRWEARAIIPGSRPIRYAKFHPWATLALAKHDIEQSFLEKREDWRMWATPPVLKDGDPPQAHRPVEAGEARECVGGWRWVMPEDLTHIMHGAHIKPDEKIPRAACGGKLDAKHFVNNMGNVAPSCPKCNEVYQSEYVAKRRIREAVR